ncbi:MAG: D-2-hydroxyacid dehydrogenase [Betaproteobacteria bacterium]
MTHHVVLLERDSIKAIIRRPAFEHEWAEYDSTAPDHVVHRLQDATIALVNKVELREPVLAQLPKLRLIAITATGYDCVDVQACRARGIAVANIRNYAVHTVPEHTFALILALRRNLIAYHEDVLAGMWQKANAFCLFTHAIGDLHGTTLGIIGEGAIGQATAAIGRAFGMRVLFADHAPPKAAGVEFTPFEQVLAEADVLTLHAPLTPATRDLIGIEQLRRMKPTALVINTSRGGLVNEAALAEALDEGLIAGAGCDVLTGEPPRNGNPLLDIRRPNFILTPHVAWASDAAMQALADQLIDNVEAWVAGQPRNLVT